MHPCIDHVVLVKPVPQCLLRTLMRSRNVGIQRVATQMSLYCLPMPSRFHLDFCCDSAAQPPTAGRRDTMKPVSMRYA